jgi:enoyl-CoA hydratase/carnithine racemase
MKDNVHCDIRGHMAFIEIDNPPVNALTTETTLQLKETFSDIKGNENIRAVVLSSVAYKNVFVAGADINKFLSLETQEDGEELALFYQSAINEVADMPCPVICAVEGLALGGGCELSLACDIRIASKHSLFALTEVTLGVIPGGGGTQRMARLIGPGYAKYMIYTGMRIDAEEAHRVGLIEKIVPEGKALEEATAIAETIAKNAPAAVQCAKKAINEGLDSSLLEGLEIEKRQLGAATKSGEPREGAKAFLEKRKPKF